MTEPLRVLWVAKGLGRGGAEVLLLQALRHLDRSRFDVEVAYVLPWKSALVPDFAEHGVTMHCLGAPPFGRLTWVYRLARLIRSGNFDVVHTHMPQPAVAARLSARARTPLLHTEHNVWPRYRRITSLANALTYGRNQAVIAVSDGVARSIRRPSWMRVGALPPVEVIVHGVDTAAVQSGPGARIAARTLLRLPAGAPVIGTVGNFTPKKGQDILLHAVARIRDTHPDVRLVMVGSGPRERHLRDLVGQLGLGANVIFAGSRDDVPAILAGFDVFALSSLYEGLSIALLEAMAAGIPCVATRVGGVPEILQDGHEGRLVSPSDATALADAILAVLADPEARAGMGEAGQAQAARFDAGVAVQRIEQIYRDLQVAPA